MPDDLDSLLEVKTSTRATASQTQSGFGADGTSSGGPSNIASSVMMRYWDAYLVARITTGFGGIIKGIGILLAIVTFGGAASVGNQAYGDTKTTYTIAGVVLAVIIGAAFFLFGVLVSAQGQILKASLDGAVNSSPFLTNDQKAKTMSLK